MKFKVLSFEIKQTKTGKDFKRLNLKDTEGGMYNGVPYWSSYPGYAELSVGTIIEGNITTTQNGQYTNHTLELANMPKSAPRGGGMGKALMEEKKHNVEASMTRKEEHIREAQSRNEVMYAKMGACEIIAHHPAYSNLNQEVITFTIQNLTKAILDFNPHGKLNPLEADNITSIREVARAEQHTDPFDEDITTDDVPF